MAQKLNSEYGYSYDNLKVLLGGWNAWKQENANDQAGYPIETMGGTPAEPDGKGALPPLGAPPTPTVVDSP